MLNSDHTAGNTWFGFLITMTVWTVSRIADAVLHATRSIISS